MRLVDIYGDDVTNLVDLEPYIHFVEAYDGKRSPVTRITYGMNRIEIEWGEMIEEERLY